MTASIGLANAHPDKNFIKEAKRNADHAVQMFASMIRLSLIVAGLLLSLGTPVWAADFVLDKPHTQAEFVAVHLAISQVHGQIPLISGTATIGDNNLPTAINATFDVTGVATNDANRITIAARQLFRNGKVSDDDVRQERQ